MIGRQRLYDAIVSDSGSGNDGFDGEFGFEGFDPQAMMSNFMNLFGQGAGAMNQALHIATSIATGGNTEPNVDPVDRIALEQLARVAELQIAQKTGLRPTSSQPLSIAPVTKAEWTRRSMGAYKPILEGLATAMSQPPTSDMGSAPEIAMFEQLIGSMRPMMVNMTTGSMVGHLGARSLATYDLPIPRADSDELLIVVPNLDALAQEWSLDRDDLRMWIALSEVAHHTVLSIEHVARHILSALDAYTRAFEAQSIDIGDLTDFEASNDLGELQKQIQSMVGDPASMLGSLQSDAQRALLPTLAAVVGPVVGYVDYIMDDVGARLISTYPQLTEALRRRRVTASESDRFIERLLGLEMHQTLFDRGRSFIAGIVDRAGEEALGQLWLNTESLPTPNEIDAPGLWLARMGIASEVVSLQSEDKIDGVEIEGAADDLTPEDFFE